MHTWSQRTRAQVLTAMCGCSRLAAVLHLWPPLLLLAALQRPLAHSRSNRGLPWGSQAGSVVVRVALQEDQGWLEGLFHHRQVGRWCTLCPLEVV